MSFSASKAMKLKQIAHISAGHPFRGKIPETDGSGVFVVQMKDASPQEGIHWATCINTDLTSKREPDWLQTGDILIAGRGSYNYAVLVTDELSQANIKAVAAPQFYIVSAKRKDILPEYLVWLLNQEPCQRYFQQNAEGTLTKSIRRTVLEDTPVAIPPLAKQQAIVALAQTLRQEKQIVEQLLRNGERLQNTIATDLLKDKRINARMKLE